MYPVWPDSVVVSLDVRIENVMGPAIVAVCMARLLVQFTTTVSPAMRVPAIVTVRTPDAVVADDTATVVPLLVALQEMAASAMNRLVDGVIVTVPALKTLTAGLKETARWRELVVVVAEALNHVTVSGVTVYPTCPATGVVSLDVRMVKVTGPGGPFTARLSVQLIIASCAPTSVPPSVSVRTAPAVAVDDNVTA
jgi:hypothetical protein